MAPEAPARFSTITGWPVLSESLAPSPRAIKSSAPPGANGAIRRIGLLGKDCANAACAANRSTSASNLVIFLPQVRGAAPVQLLVGVSHGVRARPAEHNLEIHRLQALVHITVDHPGRAGDAFPRTEPDVQAPPAFVLDEGGQVAAQHEEDLLDLVGMRGVALAGLDIHDRQREAARRDDVDVDVLARAARADEAVLRALVAVDLCVLERRPVGLAVAKARHVARGDVLERGVGKLGRAGVARGRRTGTLDAHLWWGETRTLAHG